MPSQVVRPGTPNDVPRPFALQHNLIRQAAALSHDEAIERIAEMPMVHHGVILRILTLEPHLPARLRSKQDRHHREGLLVVRGDLPVRFRTVALCVPELDVRLLGGESDGIASLSAWGFLPQFRVGESIVQSGECEGAEWELGEEARVILLILCEGFVLGAFVPDKVVGCEVGLRDFVEDQSKLVEVSTSLRLLLLDRRLFRDKFDSQGDPLNSSPLHRGRPGIQPPLPATLAWDLCLTEVALLGYCKHPPRQ